MSGPGVSAVPPSEAASGPAGKHRLRWQYLVDPPATGHLNMARDHALALCIREGTGLVRFYRWARPTVSFGRNEPARERYGRALAETDFDVVRRPTGGRAVLHHDELTYAVAFPRRALGPLRDAYQRIHRGLARGLARLGVPAGVAVGGRAVSPQAGPCFSLAASGELVVQRRKLVGSAQARIGGAVLQHGSLLLTCDQSPLARLLSEPPVAGGSTAITLAEVLGRLPLWAELVDALVAGLSESLGPMSPGAGAPELARTEASLRERYASRDWTWRR